MAAWFEYGADDSATLVIADHAHLPDVVLDLSAVDVSALSLKARPDLVPPAVGLTCNASVVSRVQRALAVYPSGASPVPALCGDGGSGRSGRRQGLRHCRAIQPCGNGLAGLRRPADDCPGRQIPDRHGPVGGPRQTLGSGSGGLRRPGSGGQSENHVHHAG